MLDKFKQLMQLKGLQDEIKKQRFESEKNGVKVVINGSFNVEEIKINPALDQKQQEDLIRTCFNEAVRSAQMAMAQKFSGLM
jgi:DNA-binding protein YbaB